MPEQLQDNSLAVYIHWPFCKSKCPYCDFNSHVRDSIEQEKWLKAYKKEIEYFAAKLERRTVTSIFFGGGTPSLMPVETAGTIIDLISHKWAVADDVEITLEANPTSIEADKFRSFKSAGINRVSVGVQALNDSALKFLGREHTASEAMKALEVAGNIFDRFSFDLIYARPQQTIKQWKAELEEALKLARGHMSLYQLTIEKGTAFYSDYKTGKFFMPEQELAASMYELTDEIMEKAGLPSYEVSNYAKIGQESRHNLSYWHYREYLGIGAGAHSRLRTEKGRKAVMMIHNPENWLESVEEKNHGIQSEERIEGEGLLAERLMMGLRKNDGVPSKYITGETKKKIPLLEAEGLVIFDKKSLRATKKGRLVLGGIISRLAA